MGFPLVGVRQRWTMYGTIVILQPSGIELANFGPQVTCTIVMDVMVTFAPSKSPKQYMATVSLSGCATCYTLWYCKWPEFIKAFMPVTSDLQSLNRQMPADFVPLTPLKINMESKKSPNWKKETSSKPTCLGSMFIFRGFSTTFSRKTPTKTWATWHWRKHLAGSEHFGVGGGHVRIEFNWKCGDALGAAFGVSGRKSEGAKWWKHFWMVDGEVIKNHHRQRFAMKTNENENDDDRHHQIPYIFIYIYIIIIYIYM